MTDTKTLRDHGLYDMNKLEPFFKQMEPPFPVQMQVGRQITENDPALGSDPQGPTKIFVNVLTQAETEILYTITDDQRLDVDHDTFDRFFQFYVKKNLDENSTLREAMEETPYDCVKVIVMSLLQASLGLFLEESIVPANEKATAMMAIKAIVAMVYDDPHAVVITLREDLINDTEKRYPIIMAWRVISRK